MSAITYGGSAMSENFRTSILDGRSVRVYAKSWKKSTTLSLIERPTSQASSASLHDQALDFCADRGS